MSNMYEDVLDFQRAFGQHVGTAPGFPSDKERELRQKLLTEEYNEYVTAERQNDLVEVADALADMIYIICGTAASYGIPLNKVFDEVHRSNMAKLHDGKVLRREDGKILKPAGWRPPDIASILKV